MCREGHKWETRKESQPPVKGFFFYKFVKGISNCQLWNTIIRQHEVGRKKPMSWAFDQGWTLMSSFAQQLEITQWLTNFPEESMGQPWMTFFAWWEQNPRELRAKKLTLTKEILLLNDDTSSRGRRTTALNYKLSSRYCPSHCLPVVYPGNNLSHMVHKVNWFTTREPCHRYRGDWIMSPQQCIFICLEEKSVQVVFHDPLRSWRPWT